MRNFWKLLRDRKAATAIEYAMLAALIALAAMGAMVAVAGRTNTMWNSVSQNVADNM
jgi:pilus assembly protein Flp/PilA